MSIVCATRAAKGRLSVPSLPRAFGPSFTSAVLCNKRYSLRSLHSSRVRVSFHDGEGERARLDDQLDLLKLRLLKLSLLAFRRLARCSRSALVWIGDGVVRLPDKLAWPLSARPSRSRPTPRSFRPGGLRPSWPVHSLASGCGSSDSRSLCKGASYAQLGRRSRMAGLPSLPPFSTFLRADDHPHASLSEPPPLPSVYVVQDRIMGFSYRRFALTTTTRSRTRTCSRSVRSFLHLAFCRPSRARADLLSTFPSQSMESGPARVTAAPSRLRLASSPPTQVRPTLSLAAALPLPDSSHGRTQNSASRRGSRPLSTGSSSAAWPPTLAALSFGMCARSPSSSCRRSKLTLSDGAARRLWHSERHRKLRSLLRRLAHRPRRQDGPDRPSLSARSRRPDAASSRCVLASTSSSPLYIPDSPTACSARSRRHLLLHLAGILRPRRP